MQDDEMAWIRSTSLAKVLLLVVTLACATAAVADGEIPATLEIVVTAERPGAADHARQKLKPLKVLPGLFTEDHTMRPWGMYGALERTVLAPPSTPLAGDERPAAKKPFLVYRDPKAGTDPNNLKSTAEIGHVRFSQ